MSDDARYLSYILRSIGYIEEYVAGGREAYFGSRLVQDATLYRLQTIAESTQRLSTELKSRYPEVTWREIAGFRNVLVHDYMAVRLPTVWAVVERSLPELKAAVGRMLTEVADGTAGEGSNGDT